MRTADVYIDVYCDKPVQELIEAIDSGNIMYSKEKESDCFVTFEGIYGADYGTPYLSFGVYREETDEEFTCRIEKQKRANEKRRVKNQQDKQATQERELKELARLQKKYGVK